MRLYNRGRQPFRPMGLIQTQQGFSGPKQKSSPGHWAFYSRFNGDDQRKKKGLRLKIRHFAPDSMVVTKENSTSAGLQINFNHKKKIAGRMKLLGRLVWPAGRRLPTLAL